VAVVRRRWDIDERGHGVADAKRLVPEAQVLLAFMAEEQWVTEDPDAHLLPHVRRLAEELPAEVVEATIEPDGLLAIELHWTEEWSPGAATAAAFALLGSFAEEMTYVRKEDSRNEVVLETVTGMVSEGHFAPHGHTVRIAISAS
jgi:hypothetical protein